LPGGPLITVGVVKMTSNKRSAIFLCFLIAVTSAVLSGCAKPPAPMPETPPSALEVLPPAPASVQPPTMEQQKAIPQPTPAEAGDALKRVYKGVVSMDAGRAPGFIAGDFNGDGSQDIAIVVKPAKDKLEQINSEVAGWLIRDALSGTGIELITMRRNPQAPRTRPIITEHDDTLLAVIHGHGQAGWRDPEAQQTFLVKNAGLSNMRAQTKKSLRAANKNKVLPPLLGDVINATFAGEAGFLFYTGSSYEWYNARTYQGEIAKRMPH
jgi:hypothetical protein